MKYTCDGCGRTSPRTNIKRQGMAYVSYDKSTVNLDGLTLDTILRKLRTTEHVEEYLRYCRDIYPDYKLPTNRILAKRLGVSLITVKRALAIAKAQGNAQGY